MKGFFRFEDLGGDYPLLGAELLRGVPVAVSGLSDAQKYLIAAMCEGRAVYVTADALSAKRAAEAIFALSGKKCAVLAAKDEVLIYRRALSKDALYRRLVALAEWERGAEVLVADVESLVQLAPARVPVFRLEAGKLLSLAKKRIGVYRTEKQT